MDYKYLFTSFEGRISRQQFWIGVLIQLGIAIVLGIIDVLAGTYSVHNSIGLLSGIWSIASIYFNLVIYTKRWHDRGKSGWWSLILLIPIVGVIWLIIELGCLPGTPGASRYGPDPLGATA
jgi:uncharacterized membrane protein YhaH (DUF805 family)